MAIAILGRRHYSAAKPHGGARVDFGHPLAQGLVRCYPLVEGAGNQSVDLVTGTPATAYSGSAPGPAWVGSRWGWAADFTTSGSYTALTDPATDDFLNGGPFTVALVFNWDGTNDESGVCDFFKKSEAFRSWIDASSNAVAVNRDFTSSRDRPLIAIQPNTDYVLVVSNNGSPGAANWRAYLNGEAVNMGSFFYASGTPASLAGNVMAIGCYNSTNYRAFRGQYAALYIFNRVLEHVEAAELTAYPFAFLSPAVARTYFDLGATGVPKHFMHYARLRRAS